MCLLGLIQKADEEGETQKRVAEEKAAESIYKGGDNGQPIKQWEAAAEKAFPASSESVLRTANSAKSSNPETSESSDERSRANPRGPE